jgi:hypothetical protein
MTSDVAPKESFPRENRRARTAIDPASEARVSMGIIKFWFDWDRAAPKQSSARDCSRARTGGAHLYGHLFQPRRSPRALQEMRRALDHEPHSALANASSRNAYTRAL